MTNIDMTEVIKIAELDEFWSVRGKAIQSYANLEQALLTLFASLSGLKHDAAAIIMFKITSVDARSSILEKLFRRRFGSKFNLFRNSLIVAAAANQSRKKRNRSLERRMPNGA
jgi:hypothetical protein